MEPWRGCRRGGEGERDSAAGVGRRMAEVGATTAAQRRRRGNGVGPTVTGCARIPNRVLSQASSRARYVRVCMHVPWARDTSF
jgi:hypothetical protein